MNLYDLRTRVNSETHNYPRLGRAEAEGDGVTTAFSIAPPARQIVNDNALTCLVDEVAGAGTMDYGVGVYTFDAAPAAGAEIVWTFNHVYWTEEQVDHAINTAVQNCFPDMYLIRTQEIVTDGEATDFDTTIPNPDTLIRLEYMSTTGTTWSRWLTTRCELVNDALGCSLLFKQAPPEGTIRIHMVCRPAWMTDVEDTPGLPDRAVGPIASYAAYSLLTQKLAPRTYSDVVITNLGIGTLSPRQMNDAANMFYFRFQEQMKHMRMHPWKVK